jgi:hypothetical protein
MRMGAAMMRLSNLSLTPALTGLIMVTLLLLGAIVVRVITVSEHGEVRTHTAPETSGQGTLKQDTSKQDTSKLDTLDIGIADLKGTLR